MQATVRTTIRIREDLFKQSRLLAFQRGIPLQDIINEGLALGYKHISDLHTAKESMTKIDIFRKNMVHKNIKLNDLLELNKRQQK